ncbi:replication initiator protein A [Staphylococcus saprophyticus]|uniref:Replication initiator protein A n=1 Tax=Staphylococcus saprophyticus TaxID=29385 RepID=A0A6G9ZZZ1_STASA|nr:MULTISPECIES: replication initiator protein A [Staphylococcus]PUZ31614.1 replication protein [Staphylococcus cohnii]CRV31858.1 replication initiation protein Rep [Streptococcus equi subsp. equi]AKR47522.1 replication protein [Staphylococcus aureus]AOH63318.1 replication protein [Staphylococcus aureus]AUI14337.1 replication protein [Staphylococcus aureus]
MTMELYNVNEEYREKFYQIPKVFFTNPKYIKISNDAKMAWGILRDRLDLSIKNGWIDSKTGNIFFYYKNENLQTILNCKKDKVIKIKKELIEAELLLQERQGLNKTNKLYLVKPEVTEDDIYKIQKQENTVESSSGKEVGKTEFQKSEKPSSRSRKNRVQEVGKTESNDTEFNNTEFSNTELNDMNDLNDIEYKNNISIHSNHSNQFTHNFDDKDYKEILLQEFPEQLTNYLLKYDYRDLEIIKAVILKAKKSFNSNHDDNFYMLEHIEDEILISLKRLKKAIHDRGVKGQKETIKSMQGYLMQTILTELEELHSADMRRKNMSDNNIFNM